MKLGRSSRRYMTPQPDLSRPDERQWSFETSEARFRPSSGSVCFAPSHTGGTGGSKSWAGVEARPFPSLARPLPDRAMGGEASAEEALDRRHGYSTGLHGRPGSQGRCQI